MTDPFILSIEPQEGPAYQYGFHLGTDARIARACARDVFRQKAAKTVALKRSGKIVDVFDGEEWSSERDWPEDAA